MVHNIFDLVINTYMTSPYFRERVSGRETKYRAFLSSLFCVLRGIFIELGEIWLGIDQ